MNTTRGRPKTLNRQKTLDVAMVSYWQDGINGISLNEICRRAEVSKPSLYREFGGEDGLLQAVLELYQQQVLVEVTQILSDANSFADALSALIDMVTRENSETPKGCLLVKMGDAHLSLSEDIQQQLKASHDRQLALLVEWLEETKAYGELGDASTMLPTFAATYILAQLNAALAQMARGDDRDTVREILKTALSVFGRR